MFQNPAPVNMGFADVIKDLEIGKIIPDYKVGPR